MSNNVIIECRELQKSYHDGSRELRVLRGINMTVYSGEILVITGPSGVGKSTLLHLIGTLDRPTGGQILFRGEPLASMSRRAINHMRNKEFGFVFQFYHLLPEFTAFENVMMPALCTKMAPAAYRERAVELLAKVGLADRMTHKPGELSGGEQQRVAIARALFNQPALVMADEPTGNLDEATGAGIIDLLCKLNETEKVTLVIVTHDESLAAKAHRWVYLHEGLAYLRKG